jgi:hypothetical protein
VLIGLDRLAWIHLIQLDPLDLILGLLDPLDPILGLLDPLDPILGLLDPALDPLDPTLDPVDLERQDCVGQTLGSKGSSPIHLRSTFSPPSVHLQ